MPVACALATMSSVAPRLVGYVRIDGVAETACTEAVLINAVSDIGLGEGSACVRLGNSHGTDKEITGLLTNEM